MKRTTTFARYLYERKFSSLTIRVYVSKCDRFKYWTRSVGTSPRKIDYKKLLTYVQYLQDKACQPQSINGELNAIRQYFNYLISESYRIDNPATDLSVRGTRKKVLHNLLSSEELEGLYYSYQTDHSNPHIHASLCRDKILLGYIVFQGMRVEELYQLQLEHLDLGKGMLYVPSTRRGNSRELRLHVSQIVALQQYQEYIRDMTIQYSRTVQDATRFFYSGKSQISGIVRRISKTMKRYNAKACNFNHLRASVIVNWLKTHDDLRKVQYLSGHKNISSTEAYLQDDLETLHKMVHTMHPLQ